MTADVLTAWAETVVQLDDRIADLQRERDTYRELLQAALNALRDLTLDRDRLREQLHAQRDDLRNRRAA